MGLSNSQKERSLNSPHVFFSLSERVYASNVRWSHAKSAGDIVHVRSVVHAQREWVSQIWEDREEASEIHGPARRVAPGGHPPDDYKMREALNDSLSTRKWRHGAEN